jgi:hypothetical protein
MDPRINDHPEICNRINRLLFSGSTTVQIQGTDPSPRSTLAVNPAIPGGWIDLTRRGFDFIAKKYHFLFDNGSEPG